ncbi:MAG: hypothetical protein EOS14_04705 [Mesorhizobium sp.]|nr:MAG: hypothetical protein EOS14_04705 [Mesorhizobium sp.]
MTGYATMTASQKCGEHFDICDAIQREKSLKRWPRKIELTEKTNPEWFEFSRNGVAAFGSGPPHSSAWVTAWIPGSAPRRFAPCSALG